MRSFSVVREPFFGVGSSWHARDVLDPASPEGDRRDLYEECEQSEAPLILRVWPTYGLLLAPPPRLRAWDAKNQAFAAVAWLRPSAPKRRA